MIDIVISAAELKTPDDFYVAFLSAVGAPPWHGHNLDALWDSIVTGSINRIEPPNQVRITEIDRTSDACKQLIDRFVSLIEEVKVNGTRVEVSYEP